MCVCVWVVRLHCARVVLVFSLKLKKKQEVKIPQKRTEKLCVLGSIFFFVPPTIHIILTIHIIIFVNNMNEWGCVCVVILRLWWAWGVDMWRFVGTFVVLVVKWKMHDGITLEIEWEIWLGWERICRKKCEHNVLPHTIHRCISYGKIWFFALCVLRDKNTLKKKLTRHSLRLLRYAYNTNIIQRWSVNMVVDGGSELAADLRILLKVE